MVLDMANIAGGSTLRHMPTMAVLGVLVVAAALAGCRSDAGPTPTPAVPSVVPATSPASNGIAKQKPAEILRRAQAALDEAKYFRVKGTLHQDGTNIGVDVRVSGRDLTGFLTFGGAKAELLAVGGKRYLRANEQFWVMSTDARQGALLAERLGGRWITGADKDPAFADLFALGSLDGLFQPEDGLDISAVKDVGNVTAVGLWGDFYTRLFVATTGKPYPLQLTGKDGAELTFSDFGATYTGARPPAAKDVVDLAKLAG